ncbi:MAG: hypothetical protein QOK37_476 [Thermoanaerobaculia bacterium]|jgi:DNA-binding transcriptional ArsR family regulator|nr:hypothetical protein [Thermoanaerobaculia bacterium]
MGGRAQGRLKVRIKTLFSRHADRCLTYSAARLNNHRVAKRDSRARLDAYEAVFSALAHPARRRVLLTIHFNGGSMTAGEIASVFAHAWQTTTRHLQVLERTGLLSHEKQGRMRIYRIERKRLELVKDWLAWFSRKP